MSPLKLILKEISHRKANALLALLAVVVAVTGSIVFHSAFAGSLQRTKRIQRDMGQNLRIVSKETDLAHFWHEGFSQKTFPECFINVRFNTGSGNAFGAVRKNQYFLADSVPL